MAGGRKVAGSRIGVRIDGRHIRDQGSGKTFDHIVQDLA
jgi:hypothetical protein